MSMRQAEWEAKAAAENRFIEELRMFEEEKYPHADDAIRRELEEKNTDDKSNWRSSQ